MTDEERAIALVQLLVIAAQRAREGDGSYLLTELLRAAFQEERRAFLRLVREFFDAERAARAAPQLPSTAVPAAAESIANSVVAIGTLERTESSTAIVHGSATSLLENVKRDCVDRQKLRFPATAEEPEWVRRARGRV